ncbi:unnamed protein product [Rhodiola kirilowii]
MIGKVIGGDEETEMANWGNVCGGCSFSVFCGSSTSSGEGGAAVA